MSPLTTTARRPLTTLLLSALSSDVDDHLRIAALLGQLMGPDVALDDRLDLLAAGTAYLRWFIPPKPWTCNRQLSETYGAIVWGHPDDDLLIDVPRAVNRDDQLLDEATREHVQELIGRDRGVHRPVAIRVAALGAPTKSVGLHPNLPLRPYLLLSSPHAYDLTAAEVPALRKENER